MDVLDLSRLQFAAATYFHFLFVPLTLGLSIMIAIMETIYVRSGDDRYRTMARFWGNIFLVNFAVGVVTGITLEFQFGTNWSRYSRYVGDIFGPLLAIEATVAFFLESTFIALWAFGWKKLSRRAHAAVIWIVAFASSISAVWILIANSWMQHPVGYVMQNGRPVLNDLFSIITQPYAILTILHTLGASYVVSGFFVMGISAWHLLRKQNIYIFTRSFRIGLVFAAIFAFFVVIEGHTHASSLRDKQPAKLASLESHWETGKKAPIYLLAWPDEKSSGNLIEMFPVPGALSILANHRFDSVVTGLRDIPADERPPVAITFLSFRIMVSIGMILLLLVIIGLAGRKTALENRLYLKTMLYAIPLPYIACAVGWTVTEVGRQPWIVYGLMKTENAVSAIRPAQVAGSLSAFIVLYCLIGIAAFTLMAKIARKGPEGEIEGSSAGRQEVQDA